MASQSPAGIKGCHFCLYESGSVQSSFLTTTSSTYYSPCSHVFRYEKETPFWVVKSPSSIYTWNDSQIPPTTLLWVSFSIPVKKLVRGGWVVRSDSFSCSRQNSCWSHTPDVIIFSNINFILLVSMCTINKTARKKKISYSGIDLKSPCNTYT